MRIHDCIGLVGGSMSERGGKNSEVNVPSEPSSSCFILLVTPRLPREGAQWNQNREASPLPHHVVLDLAPGSEWLRKLHPQG